MKRLLLSIIFTSALIGIVVETEGCGESRNGKESASGAGQKQGEVVSDKGVGPITHVELGPVDENLAQKGKLVFEQKCIACHKFDERYVGPPLKGVTQRRKPEWIMNIILNPSEMLDKDPTAKELLATYLTPMTFQDVSHQQARAILEYFRQVDSQPQHVSQSSGQP